MAGIRKNAFSQSLDIQGSVLLEDTLAASLEGTVGRELDSGSDGQITAASKNFTAASAAFTAASVGTFIRITGSGAGNNGEHLVTAYIDATNVTLGQATGLGNEATLAWSNNRAYSIEDDINYARTDRKAIKGTGTYKTALPTYERPSAVGTAIPANLTNLAGMTLDARTEVRNVRQADVKIRPAVSGTDCDTQGAADETVIFTNFHFTADDLNSFVTISGSAQGSNGTYRIKTVTDGQTLELEGLNPVAAESGLAWALVAERKAILSARSYADAVDRRGIPLADAGAYDETRYDATYGDVIDPSEGAGFDSYAGLSIWGRSYGGELAPKTAAPEGVFFVFQFKTGLNDGTATSRAWENEAGRSGTNGQVTAASKNFTSATAAFTQMDVGKFLTIGKCASDGNPGYFKIASVTSGTVCVVNKTANFVADANTGSLVWAISRYPASIDIYNGDRYRLDELSETAHRTTLVGGIVSDAMLSEDVREIREAAGIVDGDTDIDSKLTNTGNYFPWSDLAADASVVDALNELNIQIGNRDFTGAILTDGQTVTAALQALASAIADSSVVRVIERLVAPITSGTEHTLPGGNTYTLDGTDNGANLWVFWRGTLRDPGTLDDDDDYEETSDDSITPYSDLAAGDHINYFIMK